MELIRGWAVSKNGLRIRVYAVSHIYISSALKHSSQGPCQFDLLLLPNIFSIRVIQTVDNGRGWVGMCQFCDKLL